MGSEETAGADWRTGRCKVNQILCDSITRTAGSVSHIMSIKLVLHVSGKPNIPTEVVARYQKYSSRLEFQDDT